MLSSNAATPLLRPVLLCPHTPIQVKMPADSVGDDHPYTTLTYVMTEGKAATAALLREAAHVGAPVGVG